MKKRGISHIEVIMSFVIFIVAVGFGLFFFNTGDSTRLVDVTLEYAFREINQNTSIELEVFSVNVSAGVFDNLVVAMNFSGIEGNVSVETYDGSILPSKRGGFDRELVFVQSTNWDSEDFLFVKFSEEFQEDDSVGEVTHNQSWYRVGSSEKRDLISEKDILLLNESYYSDYRALKGREGFNLPDRADFGFSLVFDNGDEITAEEPIPDNFEVFSERNRVEVLRTDGSTEFADLVVKVW